jgi:hypothetical protein
MEENYLKICLQVYYCEKTPFIQKTRNYMGTKIYYCKVWNCFKNAPQYNINNAATVLPPPFNSRLFPSKVNAANTKKYQQKPLHSKTGLSISVNPEDGGNVFLRKFGTFSAIIRKSVPMFQGRLLNENVTKLKHYKCYHYASTLLYACTARLRRKTPRKQRDFKVLSAVKTCQYFWVLKP